MLRVLLYICSARCTHHYGINKGRRRGIDNEDSMLEACVRIVGDNCFCKSPKPDLRILSKQASSRKRVSSNLCRPSSITEVKTCPLPDVSNQNSSILDELILHSVQTISASCPWGSCLRNGVLQATRLHPTRVNAGQYALGYIPRRI